MSSSNPSGWASHHRALRSAVALAALVAVAGSGCASTDARPAATPQSSATVTTPATTTPTTTTPVATTPVATTTAGPAGPSFAKTVLPTISASCAGCHNAGGPGNDHWALADAGDVAKVGTDLADAVKRRYMPPWPASPKSIAFAHSRALTEQQIDDIVAWAAAGSPLDVDPSTPVTSTRPTAVTIRDDVELDAGEPYVGPADVENDYHCFVVEHPVAETSWITGYQFVPDRTEIVHHALAFRVTPDEQAEIRALDAASPGVGWTCNAAMNYPGQFLTWAPGQDPTQLPHDTAVRIEPDDLVVVQIHYHHDGPVPPDRSSLRLQLTNDGTGLTEIQYAQLLAPAELPCRAGIESGPLCDRAAAIADLAQRYDAETATIPDGTLLQCGSTPADYAQMTDGLASAHCDYPLPGVEADLIGVFGHMHELGSTFRMTLNPGTPKEEVLLDIPNWDFGWQLNFEPVEPVQLHSNDVLRMECTWDRNKLPKPENRYITWSEGTEDEMCFAAITLVPGHLS